MIYLGRDQAQQAHTFALPHDPHDALWLPNHGVDVMRIAQLWSVPFQDATIALLQNRANKQYEIIWVRTTYGDPSLWAINHNDLSEDPNEFLAPPFLLGDATLMSDEFPPLLIAATEGRTDIPGVKTAVCAITIRQRDVLLFDQLTHQVETPKNWRHLLTDEVWEAHADVTASCYVLDSL